MKHFFILFNIVLLFSLKVKSNNSLNIYNNILEKLEHHKELKNDVKFKLTPNLQTFRYKLCHNKQYRLNSFFRCSQKIIHNRSIVIDKRLMTLNKGKRAKSHIYIFFSPIINSQLLFEITYLPNYNDSSNYLIRGNKRIFGSILLDNKNQLKNIEFEYENTAFSINNKYFIFPNTLKICQMSLNILKDSLSKEYNTKWYHFSYHFEYQDMLDTINSTQNCQGQVYLSEAMLDEGANLHFIIHQIEDEKYLMACSVYDNYILYFKLYGFKENEKDKFETLYLRTFIEDYNSLSVDEQQLKLKEILVNDKIRKLYNFKD